jgi:hypothetical protein
MSAIHISTSLSLTGPVLCGRATDRMGVRGRITKVQFLGLQKNGLRTRIKTRVAHICGLRDGDKCFSIDSQGEKDEEVFCQRAKREVSGVCHDCARRV